MNEVRAGSSEVRVTATEALRRMLDERGVEHYDGTETTLWGYEPTSESTGAYRIAADEISGGRMQVRMFNVTPTQAIEATLGPAVPPPPAPDQPPYDVLLDILASEWGIDASWDGLRRFWCVELNDEGVRKRDELHAENVKLRELVEDMLDCMEIRMAFGRPLTPEMHEGFAQRAGELGIDV